MIEVQVSRVPFCKAGQSQEGKGETAEVGKFAQIFLLGHSIRYYVLSR